MLDIIVTLLAVILQPAQGYCAGSNPGFKDAPLVQQVTLTSVKVSWHGLVTRSECADQYIVKSWNIQNPMDYKLSDLLPLNQLSYIVTDLVPNQDYVFEAVAREDKGFLGKDWNRSPKAYFRTSSTTPMVSPGPAGAGHIRHLVFGEDESITGKTIVVTTVVNQPYVMLTPDHENRTGEAKYRGYLVDLLKTLSKFLKFKYEIKIADDGKHGSFDGSKWNGMIGEVISGTADIALADITMTPMREKHVDFSHPFMQVGITAIYSRSTKQSAQIYSVEDLLDRNDLKLGVFGYGSSKKFFENSDYDVYQRIYHRMESDPTVFMNSNMQGIERVQKEAGYFAYFIESPMAEYITSRTCDLAMLGRNLDSKYYGLIVKKGSPYRKDLNVALLSLMEKGILSQLKKKWWDQEDGGSSCPESSWYDDQTKRSWIQTLLDFLPEF